MDYTFAAAAARGVKLIVSFEDYWLSIDRYYSNRAAAYVISCN
jgi:hypothetical protein